MRLQQHQPRKHRQNQDIRTDAVAEGPHEVFLFGNAVGKVHDDGQLGDLRGLEGQHALLAQPAGCAVFRDAHMGHQHQGQQKNRQIQQYLGKAPQALIVEAAHDHHGHKPQQGEDPLTLEVKGRVAGLVVGGGKAGGKQHHQAHHRQQDGQQQERRIHPSAHCRTAGRVAAGRLLRCAPGPSMCKRQAFFCCCPRHGAPLLSSALFW